MLLTPPTVRAGGKRAFQAFDAAMSWPNFGDAFGPWVWQGGHYVVNFMESGLHTRVSCPRSVTSGKFYFEARFFFTGSSLNTGDKTSSRVGLMQAGSGTASTGQLGAADGNGSVTIGFSPAGAAATSERIILGGVAVVTWAAASATASGTWIRVAIDVDAGKVWIAPAGKDWNNSSSANPATGVGGISFPRVGALEYAPAIVTACGTPGGGIGYDLINFGQTPWQGGGLPAGYIIWPAGNPAWFHDLESTWKLDDTWRKSVISTTFTNGGLTYQSSSSVAGQWTNVVSTRMIPANNANCLYWEWTLNGSTTAQIYWGVCTRGHCPQSTVGPASGNEICPHGVGLEYRNLDDEFYSIDGAYGSTGSITFATGDVVCFALRMDVQKIWVRKITAAGVVGNWNDNASHDPVNNVGGIVLHDNMLGEDLRVCSSVTQTTLAQTVNFGASAFKAGLPTGMTALNTI